MNTPTSSRPASAPAILLPQGFRFGVSTSSFQIEGAAKLDGRAPSIWDTRCQMLGKINNADTGDVACDHYHRYPEDLALMRELGIRVYRFSLAWPRLMPEGRGMANLKGLDFYDRLVDGLLESGIEPWICLYHWDLPQALQDQGGWTRRDCANWFADYTLLAARRYGDRVRHWATFNEMNVDTLFGYAFDLSPPGLSSRRAYFSAAHHKNLAHGAAVEVLRSHVPDAHLGVIHSRQRVYPQAHDPAHLAAVELMDAHWNGLFPDAQLLGHYPASLLPDLEPFLQAGDMTHICRPLDWFGLNHYSPLWARLDPNSCLGFSMGDAPSDMPTSEIGWSVSPDDFKQVLLEIQRRYRLPVYVTENGCGSAKEVADGSGFVQDDHRIAYLQAYIAAMAEAVAEGADVRGYYLWTLLDNFEWGYGYDYRFGLVRVEFDTQRRIPKASFHWYADLIKANLAQNQPD